MENEAALFILIYSSSSFHDCVRYKGKKGGCDGCLNWHGVGHRFAGLGNQVEWYLASPGAQSGVCTTSRKR